jgi:Stress responsive A/B Barrel Domain
MLAHNVYFTLKDNSDTARNKLIAACRKYLIGHGGVVFFACGTLAADLQRPVNDRAFDVGLHIIFQTREDHDLYQQAAAHLRFIEENRDNWKQVRVFDSLVDKA